MDRTEWIRAMNIEYYKKYDNIYSTVWFGWELYYNGHKIVTIEEETLYSLIFNMPFDIKELVEWNGLHGAMSIIRNRIYYNIDCMINGKGAYNNGGRV